MGWNWRRSWSKKRKAEVPFQQAALDTVERSAVKKIRPRRGRQFNWNKTLHLLSQHICHRLAQTSPPTDSWLPVDVIIKNVNYCWCCVMCCVHVVYNWRRTAGWQPSQRMPQPRRWHFCVSYGREVVWYPSRRYCRSCGDDDNSGSGSVIHTSTSFCIIVPYFIITFKYRLMLRIASDTCRSEWGASSKASFAPETIDAPLPITCFTC